MVNGLRLSTDQVYVVTGGGGLNGATASTEIFIKGGTSWTLVETAELPVPMFGLRGINLDNVVYMIGKVLHNGIMVHIICNGLYDR